MRQKHVDILFIEPDAADESHWALIESLRNEARYQAVPVALIKSESSQALLAQELYSGIDLVLQKPLVAETLHKAFQMLLDLRSRLLPRALVIDDDYNVIRRAEYLLASEGMKVSSFADTAKLFDLLKDINPQILLLDIDMPGISGLDVCRKLRSMDEWHSLPVVFVSARTDWQTRVAAFECGGDDYLTKPVVNAELLQKAQVWLQRAEARDKMLNRDALTGLANHSAFVRTAQDTLDAQVKAGKEFSLMILKLNNLHEINENYGCSKGDQVLQSIADCLKRRFSIQSPRGRWNGATFALAASASAVELQKAAGMLVKEIKASSDVNLDLAVRVVGSKQSSSIYKLLGKEVLC